MLGKEMPDLLTMAVWLAFNVVATVQSMAKFLSEPKLLPLAVCIGRFSQPLFASKFCTEASKLCFSVGVSGTRVAPELDLVMGTSSVEAEAGGYAGTVCLSLASGVVGGVFFSGSVCCRSFHCSFLSSSFFFCWSCYYRCCASGGGWRRGDCGC